MFSKSIEMRIITNE